MKSIIKKHNLCSIELQYKCTYVILKKRILFVMKQQQQSTAATTTKNYIMSLENFHFILDAESIHTYLYIHGIMEELNNNKKSPEAICE